MEPDYEATSDPDHLSPEEQAELQALMAAKNLGIRIEDDPGLDDDPTVDAFMRGAVLKAAGIKIEDQHELSESEAAQILQTLKTRAEEGNNRNLCPGLNWERAEKALRADPEHLWSAHQAEKDGHEPAIFQADETGFWFGTMAKETPQSSRECVYDEKAAEPLRVKFPKLKSAVKSAEEMGFELMTVDQGNHIAKNRPIYRENGWSWYKTDLDTRDAGFAIVGFRDGVSLLVSQDLADIHHASGGWRGARRVNYV